MSERNLPVVPTLGGEQSLNRYLSEIRKFPVLTAEQEYMLAKRYQEALPRITSPEAWEKTFGPWLGERQESTD